MKKRFFTFIVIVVLISALCVISQADTTEKNSGLFSYRLKGNGKAVITGYNWKQNKGNDVYIPKQIDGYDVTEIGDWAFSDSNWARISYEKSSSKRSCDYFGDAVTVVLPDTITSIGEKAFFCTKITSITIPQSCQFIGKGAFAGCARISSYSVASGNSNFAVIDGVLYNKKNKELISYPKGKQSNETIIIPEGITAIGDYAFYGIGFSEHWISDLSLSIPSTVKKLGENVFAYTHLTNTTNFSSIEELGDYCFYNSSIDENVSKTFTSVKSIGNCAFKDTVFDGSGTFTFSSSLETIGIGSFKNSTWQYDTIDLSMTKISTIPEQAFSSVDHDYTLTIILPSHLVTIENEAFSSIWEHNQYITIQIPSSVKTIGDNAFYLTVFSGLSFDENSELQSIGAFAFCDVKAGPGLNDKLEVTLPAGLKSLGDKCFFSERIQKLSIPATVTQIGESVCDRNYTQLEVEPDSYAAFYASENGIPIIYLGGDDTSWLND